MYKYIRQNFNLPSALLLFITSLIPCIASASDVFQFVTEKEINKNLKAQFPVVRSFKNVSATFSDPEIVINGLDKNIKLLMTVTSGDSSQLVAKIRFKGNLKFDEFSESYLFEDLFEDKFTIVSNTFEKPEPTIKAIKQSLVNSFEDIVLFNLDDINGFAPKREADAIEIFTKRLKFVWY
ncbi:hypothetical protein [Paraglaciecola sp. 2405UD69-4]|uniref:hypothetical protein n=1 Tax=Paraglaciecola sp. 2405UD69-4 TaxID=3391836 RepID=UPI0039C93898